MATATPGGSRARSWVRSLKLSNFRNYASLALALDERMVVLTGPNGAGKTNLIEAVSLLSPGRGLRRASLEALPRRGGDGTFAVAAEIETRHGPVALGTGIVNGPDGVEKTRRIRVDHEPARSSEALLDHLRVVWLTPDMHGLFRAAPSERRRFLDRLVLAIDRSHAGRVSAFERALRSRNKLLEAPSPNGQWLSALETQIAELGTAIAAARRECVRLLEGISGANGGEFPKAELRLEGEVEASLATLSATDAEDAYRAQLEARRYADKAAGRTLNGPHLSDLLVIHSGKGVPAAECSTGEQKSLLVGIILAHARLIAELSSEAPIVLLDEVPAHLDEKHRSALFEALISLDCQAWMTGTDSLDFQELGDRAQHLSVHSGTISAQ
ncbi:MAG: DNA replication/repair protein RecF [Bauldia sp.]|nr:DNA replication/repair protein RecF [Bauldia sp.]